MEKKDNKKDIKKKTTKVEENKNKRNIYYATSDQEDVKKFIIVVLVVAGLLVGVYFLTRIFVTKDLIPKEETVTPGEVNYNVATVGTMLNRPYDSYYVLIYSTAGEKSQEMQVVYSNYINKSGHAKIYLLDLNNSLNAGYYDPANENVKAKTIEEFKFGEFTLIKVVNGEVNKYINDVAKIKAELGV